MTRPNLKSIISLLTPFLSKNATYLTHLLSGYTGKRTAMRVVGEGDVVLPIVEEGAEVVVAVGHVESETKKENY